MRSTLFRLIAVLSVVALLAAACSSGSDESTETTAGGGEATETTAGGGTDPTSAPSTGVTITWATLNGFYSDWAGEIAKGWEAETGNTVEMIGIDFPQLYENQVLESVGDTGAYDIITYDGGWKAEFAESGYLTALDDFIAASGDAAAGLTDIHPSLQELTSKWRGETFGLPYYTYTAGMFYRCDLWEDPDEQAAFSAAYGYDLRVPQTYDEMADMAEFFRRDAGGTLKGAPVGEEFYGIGLMAGRFPHIQDEINAMAWSMGEKVINDDGTAGTTSPGFVGAVDQYVNELLPYAPPGALTSAFDEVVGQMRSGLIAMTAGFYLDQYPNMIKTEEEVDGAKICTAPAPGAYAWVGAFGLGISSDSEHPEVAYDFLRFMFEEENQRKFAEGGGSTTRVSILADDAFIAENVATIGHYPTLLDILDFVWDTQYFENYFYVPQGGKIYDEMTVWYSSAAAGEETPESAMEKMAESIARHCDGPCEVANDHLGADYSPTVQPFPYAEMGY